jgi:hypothetical protein
MEHVDDLLDILRESDTSEQEEATEEEEEGEDTNQVKRVNGRKDAAMEHTIVRIRAVDGRLHLAR